MIRETFQHCTGIGPIMESRIRQGGWTCWEHVLLRSGKPKGVSERLWERVREQITASELALTKEDIAFLINAFPPSQQWRILGTFLSQASYLDVETTGYSPYASDITVAVIRTPSSSFTFTEDLDLDDLLDILEDTRLLVTFSGSSFDIPHLLTRFSIPELPCPHIDLRWVAFHAGLTGGLKRIEQYLGINRGSELQGLDGDDAIGLWYRWKNTKEQSYLNQLRAYCRADVDGLPLIAEACLNIMRSPSKSMANFRLDGDNNGPK